MQPSAQTAARSWIRRRRVGVLFVSLVAFSLASAGCGLSIDESTVEIPGDEIPDELKVPSTTTTTTTTTTTEPPSPPPSTVPTTPPSTDPADVPDPVDLYYPKAGTESEMYVFRIVDDPPDTIEQLVDTISRPPANAARAGLRTAVGPNLVVAHTLDRGTLNVDLSKEAYDAMLDSQRRQALSQMVLTFTRFTPPEEGGIGLVTFSVASEPISVSIPGVGATAVGEGLSFADFRVLIVNEPRQSEPIEPIVPAPSASPSASTSPSPGPTATPNGQTPTTPPPITSAG